MKLHSYKEFINESKLQLLLEAKITYSNRFIEVLNNIDSEISKHLIEIEQKGEEIDINQNHIDIDKENKDFLKFKPEDKIAKTAIIRNQYGYIPQISKILSENPKSGLDSLSMNYPEDNKTVQIVKEWTLDEIIELLPDYKSNLIGIYNNSRTSLVLIQWVVEGKKQQTSIIKSSLTTGPEAVKDSEISVGRLIRALLTKSGIKFKDSEMEDFIYKYRSEIEKMKNALNKRFKVVKGDEIIKYYHRSKYEVESGDLGNSCMRYDKCQRYFGIYTDNTQASLLLLMSEKEDDKISGRAILWEMEPYEKSNKVMDRIYTIKNDDQQLFKDWAIENGYWYKEKQDMSEYTNFVFQDKETKEIEKRQGEFSVRLDNKGDYSYYPYMDSFKYYNPKEGTLYNSSNAEYEYELTDTDGGDGSCSECGGSGRIECENCDGEGTRECYTCDGNGRVECDDCNGEGKEECNICDGDGELECSTCDGEGKEDCEYCGGDGEDEHGEQCSECSGSGKQECTNCGGDGKKDCYKCEGNGKIECRNCDGDGRLECGDCDGEGTRECYTCDGEGRHDCGQCS